MVTSLSRRSIDILAADGSRAFFKNVWRYKSADKPPVFDAFLATSGRAVEKGMRVNMLKKYILCMSDASSFTPVAHIEAGGQTLESSPGGWMKVLGFILSDKPTVCLHVDSVVKKFRQRYWTLYILKKNGFTEKELITIYKTMIHPIADYCDVVYHSLLTNDLDEKLDRMQNHALRCCLLYTSPSPRYS